MKSVVNPHSVSLSLVALLAGLLVGAAGAYWLDISDETVTEKARSENKAATPAAQFRSTLTLGLVEYVYLSDKAMEAAFADDLSLEVEEADLERNSDRLSKTLALVDEAAADDFRQAIDDHHRALVYYAEASRDQDQTQVLNASTNIDEAGRRIARALAGLMGEEDSLDEVLESYNDSARRQFDAYVAGNFTESSNERQNLRDIMEQLSGDLAKSLVDNHPEEF